MKTIFLIALCLTTSIATMNAQEWITNFETAKIEAQEQQKTILLVFQGSDWCAPCIKLDKEIWNTNEFKTYAQEHFVMLRADFPKRKKNALSEKQQAHNNNLAERFNKNGYFPYVVVLDSKGTVLGSLGYEKSTPTEYIEMLESFNN